jgi:hypothetical protein
MVVEENTLQASSCCSIDMTSEPRQASKRCGTTEVDKIQSQSQTRQVSPRSLSRPFCDREDANFSILNGSERGEGQGDETS